MQIYRISEEQHPYDDFIPHYIVIADTEEQAREYIRESIRQHCISRGPGRTVEGPTSVEQEILERIEYFDQYFVVVETAELQEGIINF